MGFLSTSDVSAAKLQKLDIKTVVNFLTDEVIAAHGKDRLPENFATARLPVVGGAATGGGLAGTILREAVKPYSSMKSYIRNGLGIDDALIETLRNALLEVAPAKAD